MLQTLKYLMYAVLTVSAIIIMYYISIIVAVFCSIAIIVYIAKKFKSSSPFKDDDDFYNTKNY